MGEIVNLGRIRKARDKAADKAQAALNRASHGRTKAERTEADAQRDLRARALDGARRDPPTNDDPGPAA